MANTMRYLPTLLVIARTLLVFVGKYDPTIRTNLNTLGGTPLVAAYDALKSSLEVFVQILSQDMPTPV